MLFTTTLYALALVAGVTAQNMTIQVGARSSTPGGIRQFIPPLIPKALNGTVITFQFTGVPGNHSVTQSSFADPCTPLAGGFDSGSLAILRTGLGSVPMFNLTITDDTKPIWFFCKQLVSSPHCISGMVGAINVPTTGNTFAAFQKNAETFQGIPGQSHGALVGVGASASVGIVGIPSGAQAYPITTTAMGATITVVGNSPSWTEASSAHAGFSTSPSGAGGSASPSTTTSNAIITVSSTISIAFARLIGMFRL